MRLFASSPSRRASAASAVSDATANDHMHLDHSDSGSIIENTHIMRSLSKSSPYRPASGGGRRSSGSNKKPKTHNCHEEDSSDGRRSRGSGGRRQDGRSPAPSHMDEYKSRSLERYAKPPHTLAAAAAGVLDHHDGDDEEEIYAAARRTLTPSLNTQRRRLLSPFVSMKRRSRSSISSTGSRTPSTHTDSREVNFNVMLPPLKLPGRMQDHIMEHQKSNSNLNCLKSTTTTTMTTKHNSASSQSGDSGTGGTELEQDCSRTSAAESSQLSLSYSQLSSASSTHSLSKEMSLKNFHSNISIRNEQHHSRPNSAHLLHPHSHLQHPDELIYQQQHVAEDQRRPLTPAAVITNDYVEELTVPSRFPEGGAGVSQYRDSVFSSDDFYCGNNFTSLVDDTYSNYEPENDAERMFLQVVSILKDEKEVGNFLFIFF